EQAQAARCLSLPALRIETSGGLKRFFSFGELILPFQRQTEVVVRRRILGIRFDYLAVTPRRFVPLLLLETKMAQAGVNLSLILPARGRSLQFLHRIVQAAL